MNAADTEKVYKYLTKNPTASIRDVGRYLGLSTPNAAYVHFQVLMLTGRLVKETTLPDRQTIWKTLK